MTRSTPGLRQLPSGKWQARISINGEWVTVGSFATKTQARDAQSVAAAQRAITTFIPHSEQRVLFSVWAAQWQRMERGGNTKTQSFLRCRILPRWGDYPLGGIAPADVQDWMNDMLDEQLSPHTISGVFGLFKRIMQAAVDHDKIHKNPCRLVTGKPAAKSLKTKVLLSPEQMFWLESNVAPRYSALIHLGCWTGLRIGELIGLRWDDVDLESGLLHVQRSGRNDTTKNGKSRLVRLAPQTVEVLRQHRRDFNSRRPFVFTTAVKKVQLDYHDFRRSVWVPLVAGLNLPTPPTLHDLRHSHATFLTASGIDPKVLSARLGHHAPSFTMDVYGLPRADADDVVLAAIQAAMTPTEETA